MRTRYGPGAVRSKVSEIRPFAPIGGCLWMITPRSRRTTIRCTPVCGPAPRRYEVSGVPDGWRIVNEIRVGPGRATRAGPKPESSNVRAGSIVGAAGREEEEQPTRSATAQHTRRRRPRLICRQDHDGWEGV